MNRIDELRQKRREIDEEIKKLLNEDYMQVDNVKIDRDHYQMRQDEFYVAVHCKMPDTGKLVWRSVIRDYDREKVVEEIPGIVKNLQELHKALTSPK